MGHVSNLAKAGRGLLLAASMAFGNPANADEKTPSNQNMMLSAQGQFQILIQKAQNSYSKDLQKLEDRLNLRLQRQDSAFDKVSILDPVKIDIAKAIGIPERMAVQTMLLQKNIRPFAALVNIATNFIAASARISTGEESYTQNPHTLFLISEDRTKGPCIIIPAPDNTIPDALKIAGMDARDAANFANSHEGWHCLDTVYYTKHFPPQVYESFDPKNLASLLGNAAGLEAYSTLHKSEAFADIAATGELIRGKSYDLSLIHKISFWRDSKAEDLIHYSAPVLSGLEMEIRKMRLERFRSLDDKAALAFYYRVVEKYSLNAKRLEIKIRYDAEEGKGTKPDPDIAIALSYKNPTHTMDANSLSAAFTSILGGTGLNEKEIARSKFISDSLKTWEPLKDIEIKAMATYGSITPQTLSGSYLAILENFSEKSLSDPANADFYAEKSARLKQAFVSGTPDFDYEAANRNPAPR